MNQHERLTASIQDCAELEAQLTASLDDYKDLQTIVDLGVEKNKRLTTALREIQAMTGFEWLPCNKGRSPDDLKINSIATKALEFD